MEDTSQETTIAALPEGALPVQTVIDELRSLYPQARYDLNFSTPLELLVATLLAAQCTDKRVNAVTIDLFQKYRSAEDYATVSQEELEQDIIKTGFYRQKAKQIRAACQYLLLHHNGEVPQTMAEMVKIPGVGRKTANVVLGNAYGITEGFIVDTHVARLIKRFGWTQQDDAVKAERELMNLIPQQEWLSLAHRIIYHGRAVCVARSPRCAQCTLAAICPASTTRG
ncbi:endonuclease III [Dictyobacter aurantiacus]|uniref:Endonuclease III n=1 Tax=Dictyobacter aurantiacus TaxID=1936993 RepID=A0A401ZQI5_9CHLR|nr:endonuclease III [Dictyobacter aurantiacus]GCE09016.1 endonuclease III [Dictyobacter aurantiacus]